MAEYSAPWCHVVLLHKFHAYLFDLDHREPSTEKSMFTSQFAFLGKTLDSLWGFTSARHIWVPPNLMVGGGRGLATEIKR